MSRLMVIIGVIFFLILIILLILYFLVPIFRRNNSPSPLPTPVVSSPRESSSRSSPSPISTPTPVIINPNPTPEMIYGVNSQLLNGTGFVLSYPENWGVSTCINSANFEFDPVNNIDQINAPCNVATKPITVIVQNSLTGCSGTIQLIGNYQVIKTTDAGAGYIEHQWCIVTSPVLVITNRVSSTIPGIASPIDYSSQIENMIGTLQL